MRAMRIVVKIEIATLSDQDGKLNHRKMDRLAMVLANLNNSGKELLLVSSGAIALGMEKLGMEETPEDFTDLQAIAAVGQAELINFYQNYFSQYNQMVAQVLISSDVMNKEERVFNVQNTFNTLLGMNIIPIINENDTVSTTDIELDDNYYLALNVAKISKADIILIKTDLNSNFIIQKNGEKMAVSVSDENNLFEQLDRLGQVENGTQEMGFPSSIKEIEIN